MGRLFGLVERFRARILANLGHSPYGIEAMTVRDRAINAIQNLPKDTDIAHIMREMAFLAGVDEAVAEIDRGEGMDSASAKKKLREWISG